MTAAIDGLRDALTLDRAERIEQMTRFETKFDTRMDVIYQMLADFKERNSSLGARVTAIESASAAYMQASDRRFSDMLAHFDSRIKAHKDDQDAEITSIGKKQDRNWGWVMALIGAVVILMGQTLFNQLTSGRAPAPADAVAPVKK